MTQTIDVNSTAGNALPIREHIQLLVVGAGPAGIAAALEAARQGLRVTLVDEHPVDHASMGLDIPFHFGQRMSGAVRNRGRMMEQMVESNAAIAEAFDAGIDVRLGAAVWGLFANRPGMRWLQRSVVGLTDGPECWYASFDAAILATGRRDVGLAFPGWQLPGVLGVTAAQALLHRYGALEGDKLVVLGSGAEATMFASAAMAAGRQIVALVEAAEACVDKEGCDRLAAAGVPILTDAMILQAKGGIDGVDGVDVGKPGDAGSAIELACDTVVLGVGVAPVIELFDVAGARIVFAPERGGHVPLVDADGRTSVPLLFAAGDCAGVAAQKTRDDRIARQEGCRAARAAATALKEEASAAWPSPRASASAPAPAPLHLLTWAAASLGVADAQTHICQCEEVSLVDLLGVRPPRYLAQDQPAMRARDIHTLAADGTLNQDQIKRLTRAGMGPCQGRRCREQIAAALAAATGTLLADIPLPSYRAPVRPLPLSAFAAAEEAASLAENCQVWFGIESQWVPFWEPLPEQAGREEVP